MADVKALCVYCGSAEGVSPLHLEAARNLGQMAAERGVAIVFGGGGVGMMGAVADGALEAGGTVVGIIPQHLEDWEAGHKGVSEYVVVDSMHARKQLMFERSDAFCALPGGLGTLDETFEIITWKQLQLHDKPIVLVNQDGYWNPLLALLNHQIEEGYLRSPPMSLFTVARDVEGIFDAIAAAPPPRITGLSDRL